MDGPHKAGHDGKGKDLKPLRLRLLPKGFHLLQAGAAGLDAARGQLGLDMHVSQSVFDRLEAALTTRFH